MSDQPFDFKNPSYYSPGQIAFNNNAEMSRLISLFGGGLLQNLAGPGNFMPHMTPSQNVIDQYIARQYQNQTRASEFYMAGAGNQDVAKRLLALRTASTHKPATELNRMQAEQFAGFINNPMTKAIAGAIIGPENLEAALHGRKGDVAGLNQVVNRIGFFRRDPSGGRRMDAQSLEDFSRGVYAHLYDEGGNLSGAERDARIGGGSVEDYNQKNTGVQRLKKFARMETKNVVSDDEIVSRITKRLAAKELDNEDVSAAYKKYVSGDEKDVTKQAEALTKFDDAIKALDQTVKGKTTDRTGLLKKDEVTLDQTIKQARENSLGQMHGFMAGQIGQMTEQMFQRGMLPQAIGAMSPAARVKLLSDERERDPETLRRLAEEFGHRDLMARDAEYAKMLPADQRKVLNERIGASGGYQDKLTNVFNAVDEFNAGNRTDVQQIEKMEGFDAVAGNVDAKRSAAAIKKYTGAVAAVREIFGENGNPNAPMPALLAALDHLSQGAMGQMDPKQIETALRAMQQTARESGIGFEQMAAMAAQMGGMGDMLGISKSQTMHNQVNAMAMIKTMRDDGAFSRPVFGSLNQAEATQFAAQQQQAATASDNGRMMAGFAGIYKTSPNSFKIKDKNGAEVDSEFAKAMQAYLDESSGGEYEFNGVKKNVYKLLGEGGPQAVLSLFKQTGGTEAEAAAAFRNPNNQQFANKINGVLQSQKYEMLRDINNAAVRGKLETQLEAARKANPGSELSKLDTEAVANTTGSALTELIFESSDKPHDEQIKHIRENMVPTLKSSFMASGIAEPEAERLAHQAAAAYMGSGNAESQNRAINEMVNEANAFVFDESGKTMAAHHLVHGKNRAVRSAKEALRSQNIAQRKSEAGLNFNSPVLAGVSDYLLEMGEKGGNVTQEGLFKALFKAIPEQDLRDKYSAGMETGLNALQEQINALSVTEKTIGDLGTASKSDNAAEAETALSRLKKLAGVKDDTKIISDSEVKRRQTDKATEALTDDKKVTELYKRFVNGGADTTISLAEQRKQLLVRADVLQELGGNGVAEGEMSHGQLLAQSLEKGIGQAHWNNTAQQNEQRERARRVMSGTFNAANDESVLASTVYEALTLAGIDPTKKDDKGQTAAEKIAGLAGRNAVDDGEDEGHKNNLTTALSELGISDEKQQSVFENIRLGNRIDLGGTIGDAQQAAAGAENTAQQISQQIANASIAATSVTINADKVEGGKSATDAAANDPAANALPGSASGDRGAAGSTAAGAAGSASAAAQNTTEASKTVAPAPPPAPGGPGGGGQELTVSGELRITNLEKGILQVMGKNKQPTATPGGGSPIYGATQQ